ncbi:hypothetical protein L1887_03115 [Cichorium endivia]|nr:hypothetical protein L1887_03115 [Cichorium endivia]
MLADPTKITGLKKGGNWKFDLVDPDGRRRPPRSKVQGLDRNPRLTTQGLARKPGLTIPRYNGWFESTAIAVKTLRSFLSPTSPPKLLLAYEPHITFSVFLHTSIPLL